MMKSNIEKLIRQKLKEKKLSISDFGRELGVSRVTVYNLFRDRYSRKLILAVSKFLDLPLHVLLTSENASTSDFQDQLVKGYYNAPTRIQSVVDSLLDLKSEVPKAKDKPVVMVVDDVPENLEFLVRILRKDYEVIDFTDPQRALKEAQSRKIDAIVTDQRMPQMTGTQLLAAIHQLNRHVTKIIVTAYCDNNALMDAINESKVDAFISKPFKPALLKDRLSQFLGNLETPVPSALN
jgi:CheY-like chemotaxis protein